MWESWARSGHIRYQITDFIIFVQAAFPRNRPKLVKYNMCGLGMTVGTTGELYLLGDNTSITNQEIPALSPTTANFTGQLSRIPTNNLNLKGPI